MLREAFEDCALTTDVMTGFPGETEANSRRRRTPAPKPGLRACTYFRIPNERARRPR
ncbi:MAG: hypothetical protein ACLS7Z_00495 [Christensenellales bacterium]